MDTHENLPPVKAKRSHIVLLILSCVCLLIALTGAKDLMEYFLLPDAPLADGSALPDGEGTEMGLFVMLLDESLRGAALAVLLVGFVPYLCAGLVMSVILATRRRVLPSWLWVASLVLTGLYLLILTVLVAAMFV